MRMTTMMQQFEQSPLMEIPGIFQTPGVVSFQEGQFAENIEKVLA